MSQGDRGKVSRRIFLGTVAGLATSLGVAGSGWFLSMQNQSLMKKGLDEAKSEQEKLLNRYVAYGGGSNIKYMSDPNTGQPTVPLQEVFYFDVDRAFCRVDNNPQAFAMETYKMGKVVVDANSFSMIMISKKVAVSEFSVSPEGATKLKLNGNLNCATAATVANVKVGGREVIEPAPFEIEAVHDERAGDNFAFTVFFQPDKAPVNHAIFGPKATFTGKMQTGGVSIKPIRSLTLLG